MFAAHRDDGQPHAFYSVAAQQDNLGDLVIRRTVLEWIAEATDNISLFRGNMSGSYTAALALPWKSSSYQQVAPFIRSWLKSCATERTRFILAPGPRVARTDMSS